MTDWQQIRSDFPILARRIGEHPLIYLDSAASAQKPNAVIDAIAAFYREHYANIHRGVHTLSVEATDLYDAARARVAGLIGAPSPESCVFVRNTTEGINLVANAWGRANLRPGDEIVLTEMEHHANLVPWQIVAAATGAKLRHIPVLEDGTLDLAAAARLIGERTRLVAAVHVSNALGTINPVEALRELAARAGALFLVDAAQSVPHMPVDVGALRPDFLAFSGHKLCGPTGVGVLYARPELLETMSPFLGGGDMIHEVYLDHFTAAPPPTKFEAGTPDIAGAVGLGAAVDYLQRIGMAAIRAHERELTAYALDRLPAVPGLRIFGPIDPERRAGVLSFTLAGIHPHDIGTLLDAEGIAVRVGHHCCQPLMRRLGVPGTARASFYLYTTYEEIDALVEALGRTRRYFGRVA